MTASTRWRAWLVGVAIAAALLGGALLARMSPALSLALTLALPGAESWSALFDAEVVVEEMSMGAGGRRLVADLSRRSAPRGALLLVHGLSRAGRRHPDLVRLARLLARQHRLVLVPHFEGLAAYRLSGREVAEVRAALRALAAQGPSIGVAGLSFGAGPALLAAADVPDLALVASFGGYADLRDVILYLTTGIHQFRGRRYVQAPADRPRRRRRLDSVHREPAAGGGVGRARRRGDPRDLRAHAGAVVLAHAGRPAPRRPPPAAAGRRAARGALAVRPRLTTSGSPP